MSSAAPSSSATSAESVSTLAKLVTAGMSLMERFVYTRIDGFLEYLEEFQVKPHKEHTFDGCTSDFDSDHCIGVYYLGGAQTQTEEDNRRKRIDIPWRVPQNLEYLWMTL